MDTRAAAHALSTMVKNRTENIKFQDDLAQEIKAGRWYVTHQGIAFDEDGRLVDGQNRLKAIIKSGIACWINVTTNLPRGSINQIDQNRPRKIEDVMNIAGEFDIRITRERKAALVVLVQGIKWKLPVWQPEKFIELMRFHWEALEFAMGQMPTPSARVVDSNMRGVVARAWYTHDRELLQRFCQVVNDQVATDKREKIVAQLIKALSQIPNGGGANGKNERIRKIERSLYAYLMRQDLGLIRPTATELFPIPGEQETTKAKA